MQMRAVAANAAQPITAEVKLHLLAALSRIDDARLNAAFIKAATPPTLLKFPKAISERLDTLQLACQQNADLGEVTVHLASAISVYMNKVGCPELLTMLKAPCNPNDWQSDLIKFLATELSIPLHTIPLVQATIHYGKVHWRIVKDGEVIYTRLHRGHEPVAFTDENSWFSDWESFRQFKDSGKRFSSVRVTQERFVAWFPDNQELGATIWLELQEKGIINRKDRLSHGWRILSDVNIKLNAVENMLRATEKRKKDAYVKIANALFNIVNAQANAECIPVIPNSKIFREERIQKDWFGTGKIKNHQPKSERFCTRIWDVSVYAELSGHRCSASEKAAHGGVILNYDHIPSSSAIKEQPAVKNEFEGALAILNGRLDVIKAIQGGYQLRNEPHDAALAAEQLTLLSSKADLNLQHEYETVEFAYVIAIPENLHKEGETFLKSATAQKEFKGNVFQRDVEAYLQKLAENPDRYQVKSLKDYINAIGAFRYMYHAQLKTPASVPGSNRCLGKHSALFFQNNADREQLDKRFIATMQAAMKRR